MESTEVLSKYFEIELHPMDNLDEIKYREKIQPKEEMFRHPLTWIKHMRKEKFQIPTILRNKGVKFKGRILEIGAGSCWFSAILSKFCEVEEIYALDFSKRILKEVAPTVMDYLNADATKITRVRGSFYNLVDLGTQFDFVVCDETLHHADYPIKLLTQLKMVLKRDGRIVCIREPIAPKLPIIRTIKKRTFGSHERKYGVTENIYTLNEWCQIFLKGGFDFACYSLHLPRGRRKSFANALLRSKHMLPFAYNLIYGTDSMPVAFVGIKHVRN